MGVTAGDLGGRRRLGQYAGLDLGRRLDVHQLHGVVDATRGCVSVGMQPGDAAHHRLREGLAHRVARGAHGRTRLLEHTIGPFVTGAVQAAPIAEQHIRGRLVADEPQRLLVQEDRRRCSVEGHGAVAGIGQCLDRPFGELGRCLTGGFRVAHGSRPVVGQHLGPIVAAFA